MKETHQIVCAIFLFILAIVDRAQSIYDPNTHERINYIDDDDAPKTECPPEFTGQIPYAIDCRQYLNCWRGRGTIQSCSPGTMFNPRTMECDHPSKVKCKHFDGIAQNRNQRQFVGLSQRQQFQPEQPQQARLQCESGASGLFAHPLDCTKFLNCDHGRTFIQDCGPGTAFNDLMKVCDWPHKVNCGSRPLNGHVGTNSNGNFNENSNGNFNSNSNGNYNGNGNLNGNSNSNSNGISNTDSSTISNGNSDAGPNSNPSEITETQDEFNGEGLLDIRMDRNGGQSSRAHSQPPFPQHNVRNHEHIQRQHPQSRQFPHTQQSPPPPSPHRFPSRQYPHHDIRNQQQFPAWNQSKDDINSLNNSFSSTNAAPSPSPPLHTEETIDQQFDSIAAESSPKTQFIQVPNQNLLPPLEDNSQKSLSNRTGRVDETTRTDSRLDWDEFQTNRLDSSRPATTTPRPNPPNLFAPIPDMNIMSSRVADDFNRYFSNPQPPRKVPPPPSTTTEIPSTATKVYSIYPSGFETIGSKCEEDGTGLHPHPYDCSRYVSCENSRMTVQSCANGFMFDRTMKICIPSQNVHNCNPRSSDSTGIFSNGQEPENRIENPQHELPQNRINEIYGDDERKKPFENVTPPTNFGFQHTTHTTPVNPTAFPIPDMSVLPLESNRHPPNTYPEYAAPHKPHMFTGYGKPSQGGDIEPDTFDNRNTPDSWVQREFNREGKDFNAPIQPTTEASQNVMKIPSGKEHVMPIYQRPTKASAPTTVPTIEIKNYQTQRPYNQIYYQPFTQPMNETVEKDETDYIPISEALKYLLRPYLTRNDTNKSDETVQMTKIENKLVDLIDDGNGQKKPLEQDDLALTLLNENIGIRNLPESPQTELRNDVERVPTTTQPNLQTQQTHDKPPASHFHNTFSNHPHFMPGSSPFFSGQHSPEFHAQHPNLPQPTYYKPGTNDPIKFNDPNKITFPGPTSQSHPMYGYHHAPSFHGSQPPPVTQSHASHIHNGHGPHPHHGPNYHSNAPNFVLAQNQRQIESTTPTTASVPAPNLYLNRDKPTITGRFGKTQYAEVSTCTGQFDCGTGFCIPFSQLCNGRDDCGNRKDESSCPHVNYQVRLSNDKGQRHMGRVEVHAFGKWGYVCDDKFTLNNANVLCRELGFNMGAAEVKPNSFFPPNANIPIESMFQMDEVSCQGNETSLKDCDFDGWGVSDCNAEEVVGVVCKVTVMQCPPNHWLCQESEECIPMSFMCDGLRDCSDGTDESAMHCKAKIEYRLMDGNELEGRVEVKYRGVWGTVCDDDFGDKEANVLCNSLGFTGPATVVNKRYGMSTGPIWLDQVDCLGNETTLDKCMHFDWSESNCNHTEDVSVRCSRGVNTKSSRYLADDLSLQRLTNSRQTHEALRELPRTSKSIPDNSNMCGHVKVSGDDDGEELLDRFRVISGSRTKRGFHPWQATIRARGRNGRSSHWCGAVVISKNHILTAAHCLIGFPKGAYFVRLGDHHAEIKEESEIEIFIENWFIHEEFRKGQLMNNDIAVILLKTPIQFTNYIQPICLPDRETRYETGKNCTISGWGSIQYGKSTPSLDLKAAHVPLISQDVCRQKDIYGDEIMDTMFCAGYIDRTGVDACDGDSGGPLVCADDNGVSSLYGIISWGQRCGDSTKPGVYVKVKQYLDWIKAKMDLLN